MDISDAPELEPEDGEESEEQDADDAGPDAPTAFEHNEGMSTVLSADTLDGVQGDAGDE